MLRSSVLGASLSILAVLLGAELRCASGQVPGVDPVDSRPRRQSQMRIVESAFSSTSAKSTQHFTIAGAVKRSGVFSAETQSVPLTTLLQAAGGLSEDGPTAIRIYSKELRPRAQLFFSGQTTETVRGGELVVVVKPPSQGRAGAATETEVIPVICVGLMERPVVLPLHPDVANVSTLVQQLMQPRELLDTIQRIDPTGRTSSWDLTSGSILAFEPAKINQVGLQSAQEMPPSVSLKDALNPPAKLENTPPAQVPAETAMRAAPYADAVPNLPSIVVRDFNPSRNAARNTAEPLQAPMASGLAASPELPTPSPMPISESRVVIIPESRYSDSMQEAHPGLPAPRVTVEHSQADQFEMPVVPASSIKTRIVSNDSASEPQPTPVVSRGMHPVAGPSQSLAMLNVSVDSAASPSEPRASAAASSGSPIVTMPSTAASTGTSVPAKPVAATEAASTPSAEIAPALSESTRAPAKGTRGGLLSIALGVAVLMVLCLGVCIVWSHYDNLAFQADSGISTFPLTSSELSAATTPVPAPRSRLEDLIDQRTPLVEEPAHVPLSIPIHGIAVGHRRLALHDAHESLAGPHFGQERRDSRKERQTAGATSERQLRHQLRAVLKGGATGGVAKAPAYDVVQAESAPIQRKSSTDAPLGGLDRALRSISREEQS